MLLHSLRSLNCAMQAEMMSWMDMLFVRSQWQHSCSAREGSCQNFTCTANQSSSLSGPVIATDDNSRRCGCWDAAVVLALSESRLLLPLLRKLAATVRRAEAIAMMLMARMTGYFCNFDDGLSSGPRFISVAFRRAMISAVQRLGRSILDQQQQSAAAAEQRSLGNRRVVFEGCAYARESLHAL